MSKLNVAQDLIDIFYPIGSYYETSDLNFNPNTTWGGTWNCTDSAGRVTVCLDSSQTLFNTINKKDGEINHTLVPNELPEIIFDIPHICYSEANSVNAVKNLTLYKNGGTAQNMYGGWEGKADSGIGTRYAHRFVIGKGDAHNNCQPYVVVKRWHRTA